MTTPVVSDAQLIIDWISSLGWDQMQELGYPLFDGTYIVEEPDRAVFITPTGGPGYITEEAALDGGTFQVRVRGTTDDPVEPNVMADRLDKMILRAPFPAVVDGVPVASCSRVGSGPSPLPVDPADLRREYTCTYLIVTGV
jgi:hypothetical protein